MKTIIRNNNQTVFFDENNKTIHISESLNVLNFEEIKQLQLIYINDRFAKYIGNCIVKIELLQIENYTDSEKIKYDNNQIKIIEETADFYYKEVYPKIIDYDKKWIYDILNGCNKYKIIYENSDFMLMPDITYLGENEQNEQNYSKVHYLVLVKRKDLLSIRDLDNSHIEMLKSIDEISKNSISNATNININLIRSYFHYRPSYWHLHIHYDISGYNQPFATLDGCHLLHNVIENIKFYPNYYKEATLRVCTKNN